MYISIYININIVVLCGMWNTSTRTHCIHWCTRYEVYEVLLCTLRLWSMLGCCVYCVYCVMCCGIRILLVDYILIYVLVHSYIIY